MRAGLRSTSRDFSWQHLYLFITFLGAVLLIGCGTFRAPIPVTDPPAFVVAKPFPPGSQPVALVLSGGSARGYAHIGVIKVLDAHGLKPDIVVGSSAGSIVGALYASGLTASELGFEQQRRRMFLVIGAPLMLWQPRAPGVATHATVTTKSNGEALAVVSELQGVVNPLEFQIPDFRSGRRRKVGPVAVVSENAARRLVGNAIPPLMAQTVCESVLEAMGLRQSSELDKVSQKAVIA